MLAIPAKTGIHFDLALETRKNWIPAFAGMTTVSSARLHPDRTPNPKRFAHEIRR
jgi:hypothetical protein